MQEIRQLRILTGFRFFAAFHVVCFHNLYLFGDLSSLPSFLTNFVRTGESAVSFFFILSGFILSYVYQNKLESKKQKISYFAARVAKLYPLYLLAFLIDIPRVVPYFFDKYGPTQAAVKTLVSGSAYILMIQSWIPRLTPVWNSPAWSLSCEIFFYIGFIFCMKKLLHAKLKKTNLLFFYLFPLVLFLILMNQRFISTDTHSFQTWWRSFPPIRIFEFFIGITLYGLVKDQGKIIKAIQNHSSLFFWASIFSSFLLTGLYTNPIDAKIFPQLMLIPLFSLIIVSSYNDDIKFKEIFTNRLICHLGVISYAIYIVHQPLKNIALFFCAPSMTLGLSYFLGTLFLCHFLFVYFEAPAQKRLKSFIIKRFTS